MKSVKLLVKLLEKELDLVCGMVAGGLADVLPPLSWGGIDF